MRDTCDKSDMMACVLIENKLSRKKRWFKGKKTKTFGLAPHHKSLDRVARCARNPCPLKRPTA